MLVQRVLGVIDEIYELAASRQDWTSLLGDIADLCAAETASLATAGPDTGVTVLSPRTDPELLAEFSAHWIERDPTARATLAAPPGTVVTLADSGGMEAFESTEFFAGFWRRTGHGAERMRVTLDVSPQRAVSFGVHPARRSDEISEEMARTFGLFVPHLTRAVQIQRRLAAAEDGHALASAPRPGAIVVTAEGRVLVMDHAAEGILELSDALAVRAGDLSALRPEDTAALLSLVAACAARGGAVAGGTVALPGSRPLRAEVVPIPRRAAPQGFELFPDPRPAALVLLDDPARVRDALRARARAGFGLTPREAAVAAEIASGAGRAAAAARLGMSPRTLSRHLARIAEKLGTAGDADLARLLARAGLGG